MDQNATGEVHLQYEISLVYKYLVKMYRLFALYNATDTLIKPFAVEVKIVCLVNSGKRNLKQYSCRVIILNIAFKICQQIQKKTSVAT